MDRHATPTNPRGGGRSGYASRLVAHRGYAACYPENTLTAVAAALREGTCFVEVDVQVSADGVPVLMHDAQLRRTTGQAGRVMDLRWAQLRRLGAGEQRRFGDRFAGERIPGLHELVQLLRQWPDATAFIEIKQESLTHFGNEPTVEAVMRTLGPLTDRCIPISFNAAAVELARDSGARRIGWGFRAWTDTARATAHTLAPEYLFCDYRKVPPQGLWRGPWRWILYDITDAGAALDFFARGAELIETWAIGEMLRDPLLNT